MTAEEVRIEHAKAMRYKRPALASLGWCDMIEYLEKMQEKVDEYRYAFESESILNALDGDSDEEQEFRFAFSDLSGKAEELLECLQEIMKQHNGYWDECQWYDDHLVALMGRRYKPNPDMFGFDTYEEDYRSLTNDWEKGAAIEEATKRISRETKAELIANIGQCLGIVLAFFDLRHQYDYLKSAFDVLLGENTALLKLVDDIEEAYEAAAEKNFLEWDQTTRALNRLIEAMPQRAMVE